MTTQLKARIQPVSQINARINNISQPRVTALSYGGKFAIKEATDLNFPSFNDGDLISYEANTKTFVPETINQLVSNVENLINLDAGFF